MAARPWLKNNMQIKIRWQNIIFEHFPYYKKAFPLALTAGHCNFSA